VALGVWAQRRQPLEIVVRDLEESAPALYLAIIEPEAGHEIYGHDTVGNTTRGLNATAPPW
jgi:hypothetical protein